MSIQKMQSGKKKSKNQLPNKDLKLCISRRCENGCHNRWRDFVNLMKPCINGYFKREQPSIKITCALEIIIAVGNRRETRLLGILSFVHSTVWKVLFGKVADSLEKGTEHEDEYMISEKELLVNKFISIPKDMGTFNCGAFVAGIVRGVLDGAGFPAVVTAHFVPMEGQQRPRTTILIKFAEEVLQREARLG
ncbi:E3 ubiquitin-protein ligase Topor [Vigna unguiculata]|uniref:E3 ubiquitin-protein ligase Topor n=1 Tax=Vigna unguiculata TaxID=3917 RepID=A0A4D6LUE0_VIGUN|nr:E3 ubiquitin-protein ligase Topor [Vigna unguiculata]